MPRKKITKKITLPGLYWDNTQFVPAEKYPAYKIFTDRVLSEALQVSTMLVHSWRTKGMIPCEYSRGGSYAIYDLNKVLKSLQEYGYKIDPTKKSRDYEK